MPDVTEKVYSGAFLDIDNLKKTEHSRVIQGDLSVLHGNGASKKMRIGPQLLRQASA